MAVPSSDALIFFGATGDLAYKQIFPSLQGLIQKEGFNRPIIGVALDGSIERLKERARDSLEHHGILDQEAF
jgi:glucose-6-phosphate 1-dehydrogenase